MFRFLFLFLFAISSLSFVQKHDVIAGEHNAAPAPNYIPPSKSNNKFTCEKSGKKWLPKKQKGNLKGWCYIQEDAIGPLNQNGVIKICRDYC